MNVFSCCSLPSSVVLCLRASRFILFFPFSLVYLVVLHVVSRNRVFMAVLNASFYVSILSADLNKYLNSRLYPKKKIILSSFFSRFSSRFRTRMTDYHDVTAFLGEAQVRCPLQYLTLPLVAIEPITNLIRSDCLLFPD